MKIKAILVVKIWSASIASCQKFMFLRMDLLPSSGVRGMRAYSGGTIRNSQTETSSF